MWQTLGAMTKEQLIQWQKNENHSNEWLANHCGVKPSTVSSWRSDRPIPSKAVLIITNLMEVDAARRQCAEKTPQNLVLEFSQEEFDAICESALHENQTPKVWAKEWLNGLAEMDFASLSELGDAIKNDQKKNRDGTNG